MMAPSSHRLKRKVILVFVIGTLAFGFILYKKLSEVSHLERETSSLINVEKWSHYEPKQLQIISMTGSKHLGTMTPKVPFPGMLAKPGTDFHDKLKLKQQKLKDMDEDEKAVKELKLKRTLKRQLERGISRSGAMIVKVGNLTVKAMDHSARLRAWQRNLGDISSYEVNCIDHLPAKFRPEVGNGHLASVVFENRLHVNGFFTGDGRESKRIHLPTIIVENITRVFIDGQELRPLLRRFSLNMAEGVFTQVLTGPGITIEQRVYAHRNYTPLFVHEIDIYGEVQNSKPKLVRLQFDGKGVPRLSDSDVSLGEESTPFSHFESFTYRTGEVQILEDAHSGQSKTVHMMSTELPSEDLEVELNSRNSRVKWTFLLSVALKERVAREYFELGLALIRRGDWLYLTHLDTWHDVWDAGRVQVETASRRSHFPVTLISAQYFILSSLPWRPHKEYRFVGISPGGLAHGGGLGDQGFSGHVFWDQDLWIYPPVLMLHPRLARLTMLQYRVDRLAQAIKNAKLNGWNGAMFPWESGFTGKELSRDVVNERHRHHVVGAVTLAAVNYVLASNDTGFLLREGGDDLIIQTARFWRSRLTKVKIPGETEKKNTFRFEIWDVTGPDAGHKHVNNSAYTNALAQACLRAPGRLRRFSGGEVTIEMKKMERMADRIYVPFDVKRRYHPEFDGYKIGTSIMQADTVLLGFPLNYVFDNTERRNDLLTYQKVLGNGPGMSWGMQAIGWLELKDEEKAWAAFKQQFMHARAPFKVWSEFSTGGRVNFITAAGGFLQSVLNGYFGLRLRVDGLYFDTTLPPQATNVSIFGLNYHGNSLDFVMTEEVLMVRCSGHDARAPRLETEIFRVSPRPSGLSENQWVKLQRGRGVIRPVPGGSRWPDRQWRLRKNLVDEDVQRLEKMARRLAAHRQSRVDSWRKRNDEEMKIRRQKLKRKMKTEVPLEEKVALKLKKKKKKVEI